MGSLLCSTSVSQYASFLTYSSLHQNIQFLGSSSASSPPGPLPRLLVPSWLSFITFELLFITLNIFFHSIINPFAPWSFCPSRSSQKIPSLGSVYHQFSQLLLLIIQTVKENHAVMWTSTNCNFGLLLQSHSQEAVILLAVLPCLSLFPTSLGNKSNLWHFHFYPFTHYLPIFQSFPSSFFYIH